MQRFIEKYDRFSLVVNTCFKYSACLFLAVVVFATFVQVFTRYVLNNSLSWTEEMARYAFIWMNMLGSSVALRSGVHAAINLLEKRLAGKALIIHQCVVNGLVIVGSLLLVYYGARMMGVSYNKPSIVLRMPMHYVYMAIPAGGFGLVVQALHLTLKLFGTAGREEPA